MMRKSLLFFLLLGTSVTVLCGCNMAGKKKTEWNPAETVNRPPFIHTVRFSGETLQIISEWYTGDIKNWENIANANPNLDYEKMTISSRIYIPEKLLKRTEPLSEEFFEGYIQKSKPEIKEEKKEPVSKPEPPPGKRKDEEFDLIGPK